MRVQLLGHFSTEVERIQLGEEVSYNYVVDLLKVGMEQWNHCAIELREKVRDPTFVLSILGDRAEGKGETELERIVETFQSNLVENVKEIQLKDTDANLRNLV